MAITELYTGTKAVDTTEWSLTTGTAGPDVDTTDGVFQAFLDVSDMVAGDEPQIRVYEKARTGDTQRVVYQSSLVGVQAQPIWVSPALVLMNGWDFTCDQIAGTTGITVLWSIRQVA